MGPNGPALATAHFDAQAVLNDRVLSRNLLILSRHTGDRVFYKMWETHAKAMGRGGNYTSGRISLLMQGGGKTRVIAIGDFFSQNILRPIHKKLMAILRRIEADATDQIPGFERIMELAGSECYSYDLSNATDRFPIRLQRILLDAVFGEDIAEAWQEVMTNRSFTYDNKAYR